MAKKNKIHDIELYDKYDPIYASIPAYMKLIDRNDKVIFLKQQAVKDWFFNHKGKGNAVPLNKIAKELHFSPAGNSADFRFIVAKLIEEERYPICAGPKGYYYPNTVEELDENIEQEENRVQGIKRRITALREIRGNYYARGQTKRTI